MTHLTGAKEVQVDLRELNRIVKYLEGKDRAEQMTKHAEAILDAINPKAFGLTEEELRECNHRGDEITTSLLRHLLVELQTPTMGWITISSCTQFLKSLLIACKGEKSIDYMRTQVVDLQKEAMLAQVAEMFKGLDK